MAKTASSELLLKQLNALLNGGQAHAIFEDAAKGLPPKLRGVVPDKLPYSAWQIVEHIRIAQRDILDFSRNKSYGTLVKPNPKGRPTPYKHAKWPDDYWPKSPAPPSAKAWTDSLKQIKADRVAFEKLLRAASEDDLHKPFPWGDGQTLLREALLIADHNAYHVGELIVLRRLLGAWKK